MKGLKKGCLAAAAAALLLAGSGAAVRAEEPPREAETEEQSGSLSDESLAEQGESLAVSMAEGSFEEAEASGGNHESGLGADGGGSWRL